MQISNVPVEVRERTGFLSATHRYRMYCLKTGLLHRLAEEKINKVSWEIAVTTDFNQVKSLIFAVPCL